MSCGVCNHAIRLPLSQSYKQQLLLMHHRGHLTLSLRNSSSLLRKTTLLLQCLLSPKKNPVRALNVPTIPPSCDRQSSLSIKACRYISRTIWVIFLYVNFAVFSRLLQKADFARITSKRFLHKINKCKPFGGILSKQAAFGRNWTRCTPHSH